MTLGLVVDGSGFVKKSEIFAGNIAESCTIEQFTNEISELLCKDLPANPCRETGAGWLCRPSGDCFKR
jgi:hypothetical protein